MTASITFKSHSLPHFFLLICIILGMSACQQQQGEQIQWQLPLQAPEDLHGSQINTSSTPEWAVSRPGTAEIIWLQKSTTKTFTTKLALGTGSQLQHWDIQLLGLASGLRTENSAFLNDENVDNPAALVEIRQNGQLMYRGWLYEKFPELFGLDDSEWKVWLKSITLRPALQID